jgi:hypothetical protein
LSKGDEFGGFHGFVMIDGYDASPLERSETMKRRWIVCGLASLGLAVASCASNGGHEGKEVKDKDDDNEVTVTLDQLPDPVKQTVTFEAMGGTLGKISKETDDGKNVYEADATIGGKAYEMKVAEDGTLLKKSLEKKEEDEANEKDEDSDKKDKD